MTQEPEIRFGHAPHLVHPLAQLAGQVLTPLGLTFAHSAAGVDNDRGQRLR